MKKQANVLHRTSILRMVLSNQEFFVDNFI